MSYCNGFGTVQAVQDANHYAVQLASGERVEATYYGTDGATLVVEDRVFCEYAEGSNLWTISATV